MGDEIDYLLRPIENDLLGHIQRSMKYEQLRREVENSSGIEQIISENLNKMINSSITYDPELIGTFLSNNLPIKEDDFQDYELWRTLNYDILKYLSTKYEIIIVPMTITNHVYYDEIIGKLEVDEIDIKHFILMKYLMKLKI